MLNLLSNAVKFTPSGEVSVETGITDEGNYKIMVTDTGLGIDSNDIPVILSSFGQVDSWISRKHEGTGLGLPLVQSLAHLHEGELKIDSELGAGTTVTVIFPSHRIISQQTPKNHPRVNSVA